ncbi:hypothetical protein [Sorangium sp. So ce861]|uniref:hypothetical protein n=1 Tax=Sorangium sp. So ce861 TaxID=3133323 RepID=UPI003F63E359
MVTSIFGICDPGRPWARLVRAVRPLVALVAAVTPVVALAPGCGGDAPPPHGAGGAGDPGDFTVNIELPPDIEARLLEIATDLGAVICERARNCCDHYGFEPRTDCLQLGGAIFALQLASATELGAKDPSEFDFYIDDAMAERCLEVARSVTNKCAFTDELTFAWFWPCSSVLGVAPKGEEPEECNADPMCEAKHGPGHGCVIDSCRPIVEVEEGAACGPPNEDAIIPVCGASDHCDIGTCERRASIGEPCVSSKECVSEAYCDSVCLPRSPLGAPCLEAACAEGLACRCPTYNCDEPFCFEPREVGEPCSVDGECSFPVLCQDGICKPSSVGFCEPP